MFTKYNIILQNELVCLTKLLNYEHIFLQLATFNLLLLRSLKIWSVIRYPYKSYTSAYSARLIEYLISR